MAFNSADWRISRTCLWIRDQPIIAMRSSSWKWSMNSSMIRITPSGKLFEEAAGISKFKNRKGAETLRKLKIPMGDPCPSGRLALLRSIKNLKSRETKPSKASKYFETSKRELPVEASESTLARKQLRSIPISFEYSQGRSIGKRSLKDPIPKIKLSRNEEGYLVAA